MDLASGSLVDSPPPTLTSFQDKLTTRKTIFDNVLDAARNIPPVVNSRHSLSIENPRWQGPEDFSIAQQKQAVLSRGNLGRKLIGTMVLRDAAGGEVARRNTQLATVPYMTERGTFIFNGNEYTIAHQLRLRPGVFTRRKQNGELESHVNVSKGMSHRIFFEPATKIFRVGMDQANIPLLSLFRAMGVPEPQLRKAWGDEIFNANSQKTDPTAIAKLYQKLHRFGKDAPDAQPAAVAKAFNEMTLDPEVTKRTLGSAFDRVSPDVLLATTQKLLRVNRGEDDVDDRDAMPYQQLVGPAEVFAERFKKAHSSLRQALWKASAKGNLDGIGTNLYEDAIRAAVLNTGLGMPLEEINPGEIFDQTARVTRMGEGGIPSMDAVPDDARAVQPSQFGFIDFLRTPESGKVGVDARLARAVRKGSDGNIYTPVRNTRTGQIEYKTPQQLADTALAFPGESNQTATHVAALRNGKIRMVPREHVEYEVPEMEDTFSPLGNMIPLKSMVKGQRAVMAARMLTQALPLQNAEAPYVQSGVPGEPGVSFEEKYANHMGALHADAPARVISVDNDSIQLVGEDGKQKTLQLYNNYPYNRKSVCGNTRVLVRNAAGAIWGGRIADYTYNPGDRVLSIDPVTWRSAWQEITGFTKHINDKKIYKVVTESGRTVVVTQDHSLVTIGDAGELQPIYPLDCVVGTTRLPVVYIPTKDTTPQDTEALKDLGRLAGLYLSEGHCPPSQPGMIMIAVAPDDRAAAVLSLISRLGYSPYRNGGCVCFTDHARRDWLLELFGHLSGHKYISPTVLNLPNSFLLGVVEGYFGGADGNASVQLTAVSTSRQLRDGLVDLLSHLGIFTTLWDVPKQHINDAWNNAYGLRIMSSHIAKLSRWFFYQDREEKLRGMLKCKFRASSFELVPVPNKTARQELYAGFADVSAYIYKTAQQGAVAKHRLVNCAGVYGKWGCSDVMWDRIVAIELTTLDDPYVYDFSVAGSEVFAVCHGLLVHNTFVHQTPTVQPGDIVQPGQLLARSNFTDQKGVTAMGLNARVAYIPWGGLNFEDANLVSESFAKRASSEHMYQHEHQWEDQDKRGKGAFVSIFPSTYDRKTLEKFDDDGVIKPGTVVKHGEPLILLARERERNKKSLLKGAKPAFQDVTHTWDHENDGVVTDVVKTANGTSVVVKSTMPMQVGDKLCYSQDTEVLTRQGWKPVWLVTQDDQMASLTPAGEIEYLAPVAIQAFSHSGRMYSLETTQVSLCVTDNHKLYVQFREGSDYRGNYKLLDAQDCFGRRMRMKRDGCWVGESPEFFILPAVRVKAGQGGRGSRVLPAKRIPIATFAMLLGAFLAEGNTFDGGESGCGFDITQVKEPNRQVLLDALQVAGVKYCEHGKNTKIRVYSLQWFNYLQQFGLCWQKFIPAEIFDWNTQTLQVLYDWLMWGDGSKGSGHVYHTTSPRLADDVQRLCLHLGMSANIDIHPAKRGTIKGKEYDFRPRYWVSIFRTKNKPEINHGHTKRQNGQAETWATYDGTVHCVTLPRNHVLYVRRNGKPVWCGNSGRYGDKGVIAHIIPDDQMPVGEDGKPFEVLLNPLGITSRTNPAQIVEAALGKIAAKHGKAYKIPDFQGEDDMVESAIRELQHHGMNDTEKITDPVTGRVIPDVFTGNRWMMKLHHTSESKAQGRGLGSYTAEMTPAKGGSEGAKRIGMLETNALLSHGATEFIRNAHLVRGQANPQWWSQYMSGFKPSTPNIPHVYHKFVNSLRAAGINPVRDGSQVHIMALTDKDIDALAGDRAIQNTETVDWKTMEPIPGGLFDKKLTGGHASADGGGNRWSYIPLHHPLPNPVMEEPIRRVLGLSREKLENVITGKMQISGQTGPRALLHALQNMDVDTEIAKAQADIKSGKKGVRDAAVRRLSYLKTAKRLGIHPKDWMISKAPVLPPAFRPVSTMGANKLPLVADPNYLYKELFDANQVLKDASGQLDENDLGDERLNVYKALKAVVGLGRPTHPKNQERQVKGILAHVFGSSPKMGTVQRRLLGSTNDLVGRAVITPNPDLDMDQVGLPENQAWTIYRPILINRLVRRGMSRVDAARAVEERQSTARKVLIDEMDNGVVVINRAPTLHRYGMMAARPRLTKGNVLQISPLVVSGFGADFDGDAMQYHVPVTDDEKNEVIEKMLPSRNLLSAATFRVHYAPSQEYVGGLYEASSRQDDSPPLTFATKNDAIRAYRQGRIGVGRRIKIMDDK